VDALWSLSELTEEAVGRIAALPPPKNGQVRAVPDERTIRYYGTLGLLDKPELRGRMAFYGRRHLAQVVAIKRLQSVGKSLAEIQAVWPTLDDVALARMSGVELAALRTAKASRSEFWKKEPMEIAATVMPPMPTPMPMPVPVPMPSAPPGAARYDAGAPVMGVVVPAQGREPAKATGDGDDAIPPPPRIELRIELAPDIYLSLALDEDIPISPADVRAFRAATAPLIELAQRLRGAHPGGER
jgi:hypothetical protein